MFQNMGLGVTLGHHMALARHFIFWVTQSHPLQNVENKTYFQEKSLWGLNMVIRENILFGALIGKNKRKRKIKE